MSLPIRSRPTQQQVIPKTNCLVGTLPEIRLKIYELIFSTTVLTYASNRSSSAKPRTEPELTQWRETREKASLDYRVPLLVICRQIFSEITPLLLSNITFKFDNGWGENINPFSQHLTSPLSIPFNIKHLILHTGLARNLFKELRDGGFSEAEDITMLGRGRITSSFKDDDGIWGFNVSNGWGGYEIKIDETKELKSLPCDIVVQLNLFDDGQVSLARFTISSTDELDFTWAGVPKNRAVWPID